MRFAANKLKITILAQQLLGRAMAQRLELALYAVLWMSLMFALKSKSTRENLNSLMSLFLK